PWGHAGLVFTQGLPLSLLGAWLLRSPALAVALLGSYLGFRSLITWMVSGFGMKKQGTWKQLWMIPMWDALAGLLWLHSFARKTIQWRNQEYRIAGGALVAIPPRS